jgi:hypothetical protein
MTPKRRVAPRPSIQSVTCLTKHEWLEIALIYAMARLADDIAHRWRPMI